MAQHKEASVVMHMLVIVIMVKSLVGVQYTCARMCQIVRFGSVQCASVMPQLSHFKKHKRSGQHGKLVQVVRLGETLRRPCVSRVSGRSWPCRVRGRSRLAPLGVGEEEPEDGGRRSRAAPVTTATRRRLSAFSGEAGVDGGGGRILAWGLLPGAWTVGAAGAVRSEQGSTVFSPRSSASRP